MQRQSRQKEKRSSMKLRYLEGQLKVTQEKKAQMRDRQKKEGQIRERQRLVLLHLHSLYHQVSDRDRTFAYLKKCNYSMFMKTGLVLWFIINQIISFQQSVAVEMR